MKKLLLALLLLPSLAFAQSVQQSGNVTRNHLPAWVTSGVISDGGSSAESPISSIGVTNNGGAGFCVNSDHNTAAGRNQLCFGAQTNGPATISVQNSGTAPAEPLNFVINGVVSPLPAGSAIIAGVGPFTVGDIPCFLNVSGTIQDCGLIGTMARQNATAVAITGGTITGLPNPTNPADAANKAYADALASGLTVLVPSRLVTAAVLPNTPTYSNGASGVGATLTSATNSTLTVDGTVANLNDAVLVNNQAAPAQNGIYTVTTAGGGVPWVLTRATYFNQTSNMKAGSYTFITAGSTQQSTSWVLTATTTTVGTTAVTFNQFSNSNVTTNSITNTLLAQMPANTVKCNNTSSTANAADCASPNPIVPDNFGTVDRTGVADQTSLINSAITAAKSCSTAGYGTVYLRAGVYRVNGTVVPKSCVTIRGDGRGETILLTNNAAPFGPPTGQQLVHFRMNGITFKESGSISTAVPMTFPNIQDSVLSNLGFTGYSAGGIMSIATSAVSSFDDTNAIWNNSNSIFNNFYDWISDGSAIGISEAGHYGATPTTLPVNSSNVPDQVVTQNRYDNIAIWNCTNRCLTFVKAADSEFLTNIFVGPSSNSAIVAQLGDDNANFPGNNYVALIRLQITISIKSPATTANFFRAGDWTYGHQIDLNTDAAPSAITLMTAQSSVTQFKASICGINPLTTYIDAASFNTNRLCIDNNAGSGGGDGQSTYYRYSNGSSALPVVGFTNDPTNGLYLPVASEAAFSKNLRIDGHIVSGALSTPALSACGGSPALGGTASDTAGNVTVGSGPPTSCTLTFGTSYTNTPRCTITPVGSPQSQTFISSNSASAITWTWGTATASQQFNYICLAQPTG